MAPAPFGFICGVFWFGIFLVGQIVVFRCFPTVKRSLVLALGLAVTLAASAVTAALLTAPQLTTVVLSESYALMVVCCLFVLYAPFFYSVHTSLSVESLVRLLSNGRRAPLDELTAHFASHRLLAARFQTMVESGYLVRNGTQFELTERARRTALIFAAVKKLWCLGAGG
jgi:hypothetical protein